jgi:hypothetical protein
MEEPPPPPVLSTSHPRSFQLGPFRAEAQATGTLAEQHANSIQTPASARIAIASCRAQDCLIISPARTAAAATLAPPPISAD